MLFTGASAAWRRTGGARVSAASARIRGAVHKRRAWARARRRAVRILHDDLGLLPGQRLPDLVNAVARVRRRPVTVLRVALPPHVSGFCVRGECEDTVVVTTNTSERQGLHVLLHELYHLLCGTPSTAGPAPDTLAAPVDPGALSAQLPSLPPTVVAEVLARPARPRAAAPVPAGTVGGAGHGGDGEDEEWAAEVFATVGLLMLSLDPACRHTDPLLCSFAHRRVGV